MEENFPSCNDRVPLLSIDPFKTKFTDFRLGINTRSAVNNSLSVIRVGAGLITSSCLLARALGMHFGCVLQFQFRFELRIPRVLAPRVDAAVGEPCRARNDGVPQAAKCCVDIAERGMDHGRLVRQALLPIGRRFKLAQHVARPSLVTGPTPGPSHEVSDVARLTCDRGRRAPAVGEILLDCTGMRCDRPDSQPVDSGAMIVADDTHGDLLKWRHQCTRTPKRCPAHTQPWG